jgi:fatty acid synthase subunit alpha, fungi type
MVRLLYISYQYRWFDLSLHNLTSDWLRRIEERFAGVNGGAEVSILYLCSSLDKPHTFGKEFFPLATEQLLASGITILMCFNVISTDVLG